MRRLVTQQEINVLFGLRPSKGKSGAKDSDEDAPGLKAAMGQDFLGADRGSRDRKRRS